MMLKKSPPKHRHDGTSPLPLGMDWSPPPKRWNGRDTVWPHDPRTGWSYCVTIPSWIVLPESRTSDGSSANTIVEQFYRVQVGVQSPEGVSTARGILRRFSDFLKLFAAVTACWGTKNMACCISSKSEKENCLLLVALAARVKWNVEVESRSLCLKLQGILKLPIDPPLIIIEVKRAFPKKSLPPAPPKHSFLRINSSRPLLEERRYALEEWMGKLLSDIDLSRSVPVASFLELEAAARSSFQDVNQHNVDRNPHGDSLTSSPQFQPNPGASVAAGSSSDASKALSSTLDYGSDNACETSEIGTPRQCSEICADDLMLDQDLAAPMGTLVKYGITTTDNGLFAGDSGLEQLEEFPRNKIHARKEKNVLRGTFNGSASKDAFISNDTAELMSEPEHDKLAGHARKLSSESVGSDMSSIRGSELSNAGVTNLLHDNSLNLLGGVEASIETEAFGNSELQFLNDVHVVLPLDQRNKMNRVLTTMQRRLVTARTDMEDLISRLNQEIAVKEYLTTKVKDLDVELDSTKQKSKENLQQAILIERERVTQMQWDMEELRRKYLEMESKLKFEQDEKICSELAKVSAIHEKELLLQELDVAREQLKNLQKHQEELEMKSKADIKVLVKEVKFLRKTQTELKQELNQSLKEKAELERILQKEKQRSEHAKTARVKLLHECGILRHRLQECSVNFLAEEEDKFTVDSSSLSDALDLLTTSDNRIGLLLAEAQLLAQDDESSISAADRSQGNVNINGDDPTVTDDEVRKMLTDIFIDNARLRKQVNSIIRCALKNVVKPEKEDGSDEAPSRKTVLNKFLER